MVAGEKELGVLIPSRDDLPGLLGPAAFGLPQQRPSLPADGELTPLLATSSLSVDLSNRKNKRGTLT